MNNSEISQLMNQGIFPEDDAGKRLIETHISWVIIGKKYAYKLKKPLKLPFLDFSTLEKRKYYCTEEIRLNQRLTEGVYLEVLPVSEVHDNFKIGDHSAHPVDYTVQMKKLSQAKQMDVMLEQDLVTKRHISGIANMVAKFHETAQKIFIPFDRKEMEAKFNHLLMARGFLGQTLGNEPVRKIEATVSKSDEFLEKNEELFQRRISEGFIRDCHGDLHSRNIFLYKKPIIFDCIEFNDHYRQIDILSEVAFFCMDLESFGKHDFSNYFIDRYSKNSQVLVTPEVQNLFNYYKCYRANVRANVNVLRASQERDSSKMLSALKEVKKYLNLMTDYNF